MTSKFATVEQLLSPAKILALPFLRCKRERNFNHSLVFVECTKVQFYRSERGILFDSGKLSRKEGGSKWDVFVVFLNLFVDICVYMLGVCLLVGDETRLEFSHLFSEIMQTILSVNFSLTYPYLFMHFFLYECAFLFSRVRFFTVLKNRSFI